MRFPVLFFYMHKRKKQTVKFLSAKGKTSLRNPLRLFLKKVVKTFEVNIPGIRS